MYLLHEATLKNLLCSKRTLEPFAEMLRMRRQMTIITRQRHDEVSSESRVGVGDWRGCGGRGENL